MLTSRLFNMRALPLIGVLLGLCLSEGIGLQLLPIPARGAEIERPAALALNAADVDCSYPPSQTERVSARVEIVAPKLKRLSAEHHALGSDTAALTTAVVFQRVSDQREHPQQASPYYSLILALQPSGRAPPRSA